MTAAPRLHPDDIEAIAVAVDALAARRLAAPPKPRQAPPVLITEIMQASAKRELQRRGLAPTPKRKRAR